MMPRDTPEVTETPLLVHTHGAAPIGTIEQAPLWRLKHMEVTHGTAYMSNPLDKSSMAELKLSILGVLNGVIQSRREKGRRIISLYTRSDR